MKRLLFALLASAGLSLAQNPFPPLPNPFFGYTSVYQDPVHCQPGITPLILRLDVAPAIMKFCSQVDTWTQVGGAGSTAFNAITDGTNVGAAMVVGSGASLAVSGAGTISATNTINVNGLAVPLSAIFTGTNGSRQFTALTATQATAALNPFTSSLQGLAPSSGGGTTNFLRADGTWASPGGSALTALTGDVTATGPGSTAASVVRVNGASLPVSATFTGTNGSSQLTGMTATQATAALNLFSSSLQGLTPSSGGGTSNFLRADGSWAAPAGSGGITALTGDVTATGPGSSIASVVKVNGASIPASAIFTGTNSSNQFTALTATQATAALNLFSSTLQGLVPLSGGGTTNFLRADGTFAAPAGAAGITALTGDVTATGPGSTAASVVKVNGAVIPTSATFLASNGSNQITGLTATTATAALNAFSSSLQGVVPASGGGTANYMRADGTWTPPPGTGGAMVRIGQVVVGIGGAANITFNAIPGTYTNLQLTIMGLCGSNGGVCNVLAQFNNDSTAADYPNVYMQTNGGSPTGGSASVAGALIGDLADDTAANTGPGAIRADIIGYTNTAFTKAVVAQNVVVDPAGLGSFFLITTAANWNSGAAITSIKLVVPTSFLQGTTATLYGIQ